MFTKLWYCHFLLFALDYIQSWVVSPRVGKVVGSGQERPLCCPPPPRVWEAEQPSAGLEGWLPGGLTFWRSVCSCFSMTSSWYTLPVRSRGGSSL